MKQLLSPSRFIDFLACAHKEALRRAGVEKDEEDASTALIQDKGFEHEAEVLAKLEARYGKAVAIPTSVSLDEKVAATHQAMREGSPLIYQAALAGARWMGYPDFLVRVEGPDGPYYEPHDAKLGRRLKPSYVLQLSIYADLLAEAGWPRPPAGRILLGGAANIDNDEAGWVKLGDFAHVTQRLKSQYEALVDAGASNTKAVTCTACS
ncbi:MAG: hypothetical protein CFE32_22830, partial [Alphaproteobacteria bacterium PA3]